MEPVLYHEAFDSADHLFQVKWDGVRSLAYADGGVRLINRHLNERTAQYPEIAGTLGYLPEGTVLDGEMIVLWEGKPDFYRVMKREMARDGGKIRMLARELPAAYMVFDVIMHRGEMCAGAPLAKRQEMLGNIVRGTERVHLVDSVDGRGRALFAAVAEAGLEGIVAKRKDSPYLIGQKSELWKKIKVWRVMEALVGGWSEDAGRIRSLALGRRDGEGLGYVGNVGTGFSEAQWKALWDYLRAANPPGTECPFAHRPASKTLRWAKPALTVTVRYMEMLEDGRLRHPVAVGIKEIGDM